MASRKRMNIYIPKYFIAVRNCIKYFRSLRVRGTSLLTCSYIGELRHGRKLNARMNPSSLVLIPGRVLS